MQQFARVSVESDEFLPCDMPENLKNLGMMVDARLKDPDIAGVVITHGTNTIEETAYFLNLTMKHEKPVVVVGAQRPFSTLSSDAPLEPAQRHPRRRRSGLARQGHAGRRQRPDQRRARRDQVEHLPAGDVPVPRAWESSATPIPTGSCSIARRLRKHTTQSQFDLGKITAFPKVSILYSHAGDDGDLAKAAVAAGAKGLVIAGTGAGHTQNARKALKALFDETGVVVVRSNRTGAGRVIRDDNWQEPGFVAADNLEPAEGAHPAAARPDDDREARRHPADVRRVLSRQQREAVTWQRQSNTSIGRMRRTCGCPTRRRSRSEAARRSIWPA